MPLLPPSVDVAGIFVLVPRDAAIFSYRLERVMYSGGFGLVRGRWEPEAFPWAKQLEEASPIIQVRKTGSKSKATDTLITTTTLVTSLEIYQRTGSLTRR